MKLSKQLETDARPLHTSTSPQISATSSQCEDVKDPSGGRFKSAAYGAGRYLPHGRDQRPNDGKFRMHMSADKTQLEQGTEMLMATSHRSQDHSLNTCITMEGLKDYLTIEELSRLQMEPCNLCYLWSASSDPPITKASLSELDLNRIINDPKLRHDLNFEREVAFRPNYYGPRGKQKKLHAKQYWEALAIEFAVYIARRHGIVRTASQLSSPWLLGPSNISSVPWRLPRMFETIRDTLKTLVPNSEWPMVDQRLDVDLLMQELDKDASDLIALSEWLGALLLGSCSPLRDPSVSAMVQKIQCGVEQNNARMLVGGLEDLFAVLETMKLDVANHQIRYLRLLMIDDTVHFEQKYFLRKIEGGMEVSEAIDWYDAVVAHEERPYRLAAFTRAIIDMIITGDPISLPSFTFDADRLRTMQADFRTCMRLVVCGEALTRTIHVLGHANVPLTTACEGLMHRLSCMSEVGLSRKSWLWQSENVALEIVREGYKLCNIQGLPSEKMVTDTEKFLQKGWRTQSDLYQELESFLCRDLENRVDQEVESTVSLTPLQILNHHNPEPALREPKNARDRLQSIARRIAHIAILHWRVWGPILYHQSRTIVSTSNTTALEECSVDEDQSSQPVFEDGPRMQPTHSSLSSCPAEARSTPRETADDPNILSHDGQEPVEDLNAAVDGTCSISK